MSLASIHVWGQRITRIAGVGPGAKYYLEQDGDNPENAGWRVHLHLSLYFKGYKSDLAQRIVRLKITDQAMTQVFEHDDVNRLTTYPSGHKSQEKARKVATDHLWRQANGLKEYYTRSDANFKDLGLDYHGRARRTVEPRSGRIFKSNANVNGKEEGNKPGRQSREEKEGSKESREGSSARSNDGV